jgi:hypothetical protein
MIVHLVKGIIYRHNLVSRSKDALKVLPEPLNGFLHGFLPTVSVDGLPGDESTVRAQPGLDQIFGVIYESEIVFVRNAQGHFILLEIIDFHHGVFSFLA